MSAPVTPGGGFPCVITLGALVLAALFVAVVVSQLVMAVW